MWAADPWLLRDDGSRPSCFERERDSPKDAQPAARYFQEALDGVACNSNWYEGSLGGQFWRIPDFPDKAPALLGFDETIDEYCWDAKIDRGDWGRYPHAENCRRASMNILSLHGNGVPYNICRNLEWMTCAASGLLPGQGGRSIVFARAPDSLDYGDGNDKSLGDCRGYRPEWMPQDCSDYGYATDSIFFLETCLLSFLCTNNHDMWALNVGDRFQCEFSTDKFLELQQALQRAPRG